jgi:3-carboxy-cis,cis-muconate cycloisomerase
VTSHVIDSALFRDQFGTEEMRRGFGERHLIQCWLDVEAALARAEARAGVIPEKAAREITEAARVDRLDFGEIKRRIDVMVHPLMPFVTVFAESCPDGSGEYVHWGATTQDIMDTACMLQLREALAIIERQLQDVMEAFAALAERHRDTPMPGRTHGQHAVPITFGFKLAVFLAEFGRHRERLWQLRPRLLVTQLSGAVGTMASLGEKGPAVQQHFAEELGLSAPPIAWHTARDALAEFTFLLGMIGATCAKAANEVIQLQKTEVGEVEELNTEANVGSSTMPQKRNPMMCEIVVSIGRILQQHPAVALDAMVQQHERDMSAWQAEWEFIPEVAILASGALEQTRRIFTHLTVRPERMAANLQLTGGLINAEAVMMALAPHIGRQRAHELVGHAARMSFETGIPFVQALREEPAIAAVLDEEALASLLRPEAYLGESIEAVGRVLAGTGLVQNRSRGGN